MGDTNFRATFSADTSNLQSQMRQIRDEAKDLADEMISDSVNIAKATDQNVNKILKEQLALYEKRLELLKAQERMELNASYNSRISAIPRSNYNERYNLIQERNRAMDGLDDKFGGYDLQADLLKEIILTLKENAVKQMVQDADAAADNIRAVREGKTSGMSSEEEFKARVQSDLAKPERKSREEKESTMWETAKGTLIGQMLMAAMTKLGNVAQGVVSSTDGEIAATKLWSVIPVVGDALATAAARHVELADQRDRAANYIRARGANVDLLQDEEVQKALIMDEETYQARKRNDIKDNVKVYNPAAQKAEETARMIRLAEQGKKDEAEAKAELAKEEASSRWKYLEAGVDGIDFINRAGKLLPAIGSASNLAGQTKSLIDITQGGGIDEGTALGMANIIRQNGGGDLRNVMGQVVGALSAGGTTKALRDSHVGDIVSMANSRFGEGFATADPVKLAKVKAAFQNNFGNTLGSANNIQSIMQSMSKPSDEYQQALNYKIYADQMAREGKEASYVGFQQWQEKPEDGLLGGKMNYLKNVYGSGQFGVMAMQGAGIGKTWEANELYLKGGTKGLSAEEIAAKGKVTGFDATGYATNRQKDQARLTDAYTKGMFSGLHEAFSQVAEAIERQSAVAGALLAFLKTEKKN